jgi:hypothetical protein
MPINVDKIVGSDFLQQQSRASALKGRPQQGQSEAVKELPNSSDFHEQKNRVRDQVG